MLDLTNVSWEIESFGIAMEDFGEAARKANRQFGFSVAAFEEAMADELKEGVDEHNQTGTMEDRTREEEISSGS